MRIHQMEDLQYPRWLQKILRHHDQDERQTESARHWDTVRPVLVKAFAQEARDSDEGYWSLLIHEGSNKKRIENCKDNTGSQCYFTSYKRTLWWYSNKSRIDELQACSYHWKEHIFQRGIWSEGFQSILGVAKFLEEMRMIGPDNLLYSPESFRT